MCNECTVRRRQGNCASGSMRSDGLELERCLIPGEVQSFYRAGIVDALLECKFVETLQADSLIPKFVRDDFFPQLIRNVEIEFDPHSRTPDILAARPIEFVFFSIVPLTLPPPRLDIQYLRSVYAY